ncbi:hypothetical protein ACQJBY_051608 [Aegilops geniculata]
MKGGGAIRSGGGGGGGLMRTRLRLPVVLLSCSLFFLAGFLGSLLFTQDPQGEEDVERPLRRERLMEAVWPEMAYGESGEPAPSLIPYQILSWQPRALYFPQFATAEQCENVVKTAKARLRPSTLALRKGESEETTKGIRTSSGTFLSAEEDPTGALAEIETKIAKATMMPRSHGEVASFLLYLTDVEEGGETMFPYENGDNMNIGYDYEQCIGLKVKPRKGDGLLFYSLMVNGTIDPTSLHGSCPVVKGEKWVATKWIRDKTV